MCWICTCVTGSAVFYDIDLGVRLVAVQTIYFDIASLNSILP